MSDNTTMIDRESATKARAALHSVDRATMGEILITVLDSVLRRKLGEESAPIPENDDIAVKFERFFDIMFDVAPTNDPLPVERVIELADRALTGLRETIEEIRNDPEEEDDADGMIRMYSEDAAGYEDMLALLRAGDTKAAIKLWDHMDTAARGRLYADDPIEGHHFAIFLNENYE